MCRCHPQTEESKGNHLPSVDVINLSYMKQDVYMYMMGVSIFVLSFFMVVFAAILGGGQPQF